MALVLHDPRFEDMYYIATKIAATFLPVPYQHIRLIASLKSGNQRVFIEC